MPLLCAKFNGFVVIRAKVAVAGAQLPAPSEVAGWRPSCRRSQGAARSAGCTAARHRAECKPSHGLNSFPSSPYGRDVASHISSARTRTRATDPHRQQPWFKKLCSAHRSYRYRTLLFNNQQAIIKRGLIDNWHTNWYNKHRTNQARTRIFDNWRFELPSTGHENVPWKIARPQINYGFKWLWVKFSNYKIQCHIF